MVRETARLFCEPRLPQHFALGRLSAGGALDADRVRRIADLSGFGPWLRDEPPILLVVRLHRNVDVRVGGLTLHVQSFGGA
jgi:hypothetical protein